jgi:hypothetical protein
MKKYGLVGPEDYIKPSDNLFSSFLLKDGIPSYFNKKTNDS